VIVATMCRERVAATTVATTSFPVLKARQILLRKDRRVSNNRMSKTAKHTILLFGSFLFDLQLEPQLHFYSV